MQKRFLFFGAISGAMAVILGAMGAHTLKAKVAEDILTTDNLLAFETAVKYQMYHSILLLIYFLLENKVNNKLLSISGYLIISGIVLFSGSIYILSTSTLLGLENVRFLGPVTPFGGLLLISGWITLAFSPLKRAKKTE